MIDNTEYGAYQNISSDRIMDDILDHLTSEYVLNVFQTEIENFMEQPFSIDREPPNITASFERAFTQAMQDFPTDSANIATTRSQVYYYIIDTFKNAYGLSINVSDNPGVNYQTIYWLYDLLICHLNRYVLEFFGNYIIGNVDDIIAALDLTSAKSNIDTSLGKYYANPKMIYIIYYTYAIVKYMSGFDFTIHDIINSSSLDSSVKQMLNNTIYDDGSFFKNFFAARIFNNEIYAAPLVSELKSYIANRTRIKQLSIDDFIKEG